MSDYKKFLEAKALTHIPTGIKGPLRIHQRLFPFQSDLARLALRRGRCGLFEDTGLGKSIQEIECARQIESFTRRPVLILTPLAVASQMQAEGLNHLGVECQIISGDAEVGERGIYIINYQKLHKLDALKFSGVILDEASILKGLDRSTASRLIEAFQETPFRIVATATPAPNDTMEIGAYAEFLGVMSATEMLSTFFVHDGGETQKWRLKGHAEADFWKWMASWCACIKKPSDLGYSNEGYDLPPLNMREHVVASDFIADGELFASVASTLPERRAARRGSITERVALAARLANEAPGQWLMWCNLNDESAALADSIPGAVEITGSDSDEHKEKSMLDFIAGKTRVVVSKPVIAGMGLNLQNCHQTAFVGLSDSWEQFYQAVRRFWRFGQTSEVHAHIIISEAEGAVLKNIKRKEAEAMKMQTSLVSHMARITKGQIHGSARTALHYNPDMPMKIPNWLQPSI